MAEDTAGERALAGTDCGLGFGTDAAIVHLVAEGGHDATVEERSVELAAFEDLTAWAGDTLDGAGAVGVEGRKSGFVGGIAVDA